ncbi:TrmH family RNA methyltransferase [Priestia taiwanensis]|uniref:23S rRNA methyltransferase n=1 Tax=Priestia taiwanensis TaxID=1347902 RepID=A0A917AVZ8_9BACI|nr:RNA methyltransferase [Priestia taiwanensis]MBM7363500.1 TrmH family RNA methyltransferase [Priestia taiwanensis]GGE76623.1 23S rRNA methyltransferase [Priestia taiwanensis]
MKRIDSIQNGSIKTWKKLHTKKERDKVGKFLVEGFHLVEEALKAEVVETVLIIEDITFPSGWKMDNADVVIVTKDIMQVLSETETPQGIIAVCQKGDVADIDLQGGTYLLLDAVQDPGNIGTMIRTADAAGVRAVIIGNGSVDVYNSKAIRSTQGSLFHVPVIKGDLKEWITKLQVNGVKVYGTSLHEAKPYQEVAVEGPAALIVGNEGSGVQEEVLVMTDENLYIPIHGRAESLNVAVACGILLYYVRG